MSRAKSQRTITGSALVVDGIRMFVGGEWFQLADKAESRVMPTTGQAVRFTAYDYGQGIETFFRWDDPNAPTCRFGHAMTPGRVSCDECARIQAAKDRRFSNGRTVTRAPQPVAKLPAPVEPDRGFEIRRIALECASRTCRDYAESSLIEYARKLEAYLAGPQPQPVAQPVAQPAPIASIDDLQKLLAQLQPAAAAAAEPVTAQPVEAAESAPVRRRRSRAIA